MIEIIGLLLILGILACMTFFAMYDTYNERKWESYTKNGKTYWREKQ